jgi:hypothetical protein
MEAWPPASIHESRAEPLSPYTWWLIVANLFLVFIHLLFYCLVVPVYRKIYESFGGQLPGPTQLTVELSVIFTEYWFVSFPLLIAILVAAGYLLNKYVLKDLFRKILLTGSALSLAFYMLWGMLTLYLVFHMPPPVTIIGN